MNDMKKRFALVVFLLPFFAFAQITILHTNDVHTYIDKNLTYSKISGYKKSFEAEGKDVFLVDAGDHVQGTLYGSIDGGESIVNLMNAAGYDASVPGNHEFDYGLEVFERNVSTAEFPYLCCNLYRTKNKKTFLPSYKVFNAGKKKIAFVGVGTPESIGSASPKSFMYKGHKKRDCDFWTGKEGRDFFASVQKAVDKAGKEADYVILLTHLGIDGSSFYTSRKTIAETYGINAVIDGHSHSVIEGEIVKNKKGKDVILAQTGTAFANLGKITIEDDGTIKAQLLKVDQISVQADEKVLALEKELIEKVNAQYEVKIADVDFELFANEGTQRVVRMKETNMGDFCTDALYYICNETEEIQCDVVILNSGAVRSNIENPITLKKIKNVFPFGNGVCVKKVKGQKILEALEWGSRGVGITANGGFLQVAGLTYEIDASIEPNVADVASTFWTGSKDGTWRVKNVKIYNKKKEAYEDLDLEKEYGVASITFLIENCGDGFAMFENTPMVAQISKGDFDCLVEYVKNFKSAEDGSVQISSKNSPLNKYRNFKIDYENKWGAERIRIEHEKH